MTNTEFDWRILCIHIANAKSISFSVERFIALITCTIRSYWSDRQITIIERIILSTFHISSA